MSRRCKQRRDKSLPVSVVVTSNALADPLRLEPLLAKSHGQLVFPNRAVETCLDRVCQLVVLQVLFTATGNRDLVAVEVRVDGQRIDLAEVVDQRG